LKGFVKVCGLTTPAAVEAVAQAGADAAGFIFSPSPRLVNPGRAADLADGLPRHIKRVAVFRHPPRGWIEMVLAEFPADWVQTDVTDFAERKLGRAEPLPVLRTGEDLPEELPPRLLFEGPHSGSGVLTDLDAAATLARRTKLVLAGGLNEHNVAEAVGRVKPWGVDVSSGVEVERGVKDPERIRRFVAAARRAFASAARQRDH
jgi:phosphoribosylanthranilate isomerase